MEKYVNRDRYLRKLLDSKQNGEVKIITGPRRSGKSWLLSRIYRDHLLSTGVEDSCIIRVSLDMDTPDNQPDLNDRKHLRDYLYNRIVDDDKQYYIFLDEVQEVDGFEKIVNGLKEKENVDVYITGSNSKFLSNDIRTIFRGRCDEIRVWPFSFKEFCTERTESISELWKEYYTYGGLPALRAKKTPAMKSA